MIADVMGFVTRLRHN